MPTKQVIDRIGVESALEEGGRLQNEQQPQYYKGGIVAEPICEESAREGETWVSEQGMQEPWTSLTSVLFACCPFAIFQGPFVTPTEPSMIISFIFARSFLMNKFGSKYNPDTWSSPAL
jgi:hypothetical protein